MPKTKYVYTVELNTRVTVPIAYRSPEDSGIKHAIDHGLMMEAAVAGFREYLLKGGEFIVNVEADHYTVDGTADVLVMELPQNEEALSTKD